MVTFKEGSLLFASAAVDGPPAPPPTITRFLPMKRLPPVTSFYRKVPHVIPAQKIQKYYMRYLGHCKAVEIRLLRKH